MYNPNKDGIDKRVMFVLYNEAKPSSDFVDLVDNFWELKTEKPLSEDFILHVIPDACVNILFNLQVTSVAAVTARKTKYVALNLGKSFHYVGVQLTPGVWRGNPDNIADDLVDTSYVGELPLVETNKKLVGLSFSNMQFVLSELVRQFIIDKLITGNGVTTAILLNLNSFYSVKDMAKVTALSCRQLQRVLKKTTGFTPHDFLKVLRLQQSFSRHYLTYYTDQSHFIHSFKEITGYTPGEFFQKFNV
jgi:AraC-like DNA-binding protein